MEKSPRLLVVLGVGHAVTAAGKQGFDHLRNHHDALNQKHAHPCLTFNRAKPGPPHLPNVTTPDGGAVGTGK